MDWNKILDPGTLAILLCFTVPIAAIVAAFADSIAKHQADAELKRRMIERGMSAGDIERVLAVSSHRQAPD